MRCSPSVPDRTCWQPLTWCRPPSTVHPARRSDASRLCSRAVVGNPFGTSFMCYGNNRHWIDPGLHPDENNRGLSGRAVDPPPVRGNRCRPGLRVDERCLSVASLGRRSSRQRPNPSAPLPGRQSGSTAARHRPSRVATRTPECEHRAEERQKREYADGQCPQRRVVVPAPFGVGVHPVCHDEREDQAEYHEFGATGQSELEEDHTPPFRRIRVERSGVSP